MSTQTALKMTGSAILATFALAGAMHEAAADERRMHSSSCTFYYDNIGTTLYNGAYFSNSSTTAARSIYCPVVTDSHLAHNQATTLNVHGYERAGESNYSRACVKHYNNAGTACGATRYWGSNYAGGAGLDLAQWVSYPASFPYILTTLDVGGQFYGYWFRD